MSDLIATLNSLVNLTPDEIAVRVCDPFPKWRSCSDLTLTEWETYGDTKIVILHSTRQPSQCEKHHKVGVERTDKYHPWTHASFTRLRDFSFRSKISWENHPDEGLPACQRHSSPF